MSKIKLNSDAIKEAAACLKVLSHPVRLEIVRLLAEREMSVGEIAKSCGIAHNAASTHLKLLERCRLLANTRHAQSIRYRILERHLLDLLRCIEKRFG